MWLNRSSRHALRACGMTVLLLSARLDAQIIRRPRAQTRTPSAWAVGTLGLFVATAVDDGSTNSRWEFGNAPQFGVSLEAPLQGGGSSTYGIAGTIARVPLTYVSGSDPLCTTCDADGLVSQLLLTFHNGGASIGFYQVFEFSAGITMFSNFQQRGSRRKIGPPGIDADPTFGLGYGFGYALSRMAQVQVVQNFGVNIHQRTNLPGGAQTTSGMYVTRIGIRYGLGG